MTEPKIGWNSSVPKHIQNELIRCAAMGDIELTAEERARVNEIIRKSIENHKKKQDNV